MSSFLFLLLAGYAHWYTKDRLVDSVNLGLLPVCFSKVTPDAINGSSWCVLQAIIWPRGLF